MVNKTRLIKLTQRLIQIDSQNPPGDEREIARFVKRYLLNLGLNPKIYEFKKRRSNVVVEIKGRGKKRLIISPHLDTVPAGRSWRINPFLGKIFKDRIYGLGATDCKGNLASCLEAIHSLKEEKVILNYHLIFAGTADEETGSNLGIVYLLNKGILKADAGLILDADDFSIIVTQKGLMHLKIKLKGKRAHGAYPWQGINAIEMATNIIQRLKEHKFNYPENRYLRPPTLNLGTIHGGDKVNIVADWCEFEIDFRFLPGMKEERILNTINSIVQKQVRRFYKDRSFKDSARIEIESIQKPYEIEEDHSLVRHLIKAMLKLRIKPILKGSEGATTITFFQEKGIPAVATGFGCFGCAHTAGEYVRIDNLYKGALVLEEFLKTYDFN
ncbi:MAG: M20 family metallopeptidase [Candidatus Omnitrophica bacterium]|nr:M20 family metallopeptidase [Candidatus Omnitrophota bacterium]